MIDPLDLTVERDDEGLYVEFEGLRFRGSDLPPEGTWIRAISSYTSYNQRQIADVEWSGETPSGRCCATLEAS